jgi:EmrB/QacA subfamily drug resistance transporter
VSGSEPARPVLAPASEPTGRRRSGAPTLVATGLGLFMIFLDATIVNVAIPDIQRHFDTGEAGIQWVVAAYSLTMAMFMMTGATFGDLRGRRLAYVIGIVLFCVASIGCAAAPTLPVLVAARGVQGAGAAVVNVASLALVGAAYPDPKEKANAIGIWTGIATIGLAIGPTVGGFLTDEVGWRSIFAFNPIIGVVAIVLTFACVDESRDTKERSFDVPGQLLFIVGVGAVTFALIQAPQSGWLSGIIIGSFVISAVTIATFVWAELHRADPMMDVRVFRDRVYSTALYIVFAILFCAYGTLFIVTQYFQNVREYSPEKTGVLMLAFTVPSIILSPIAGRVAANEGGRRPALLGSALAVIATGIWAATDASELWITLIALAFLGAGAGLGIPSSTSVAMGGIPPERSGMASGILSSQRALGSTAGFAIMGSVLAITVSTALPGRLETLVPNEAQREEVSETVADDANPEAIATLIGPGKPLPDNVQTEDEILEATDDVFIDGIRLAMLVGCAIVLSALIVGWFVFPRRRGADP